MNKYLHKVLKENRQLLETNLVPEPVIECMLETSALTPDDQEELEQEDERKTKVKKLLKMVEKKGIKCFESFLDALVRTDNTNLANVLKESRKVPTTDFDDENRKSLPHLESIDSLSQTFILHNEDHTLGNALRYVIMKDPRVEFCGYGVPHPFDKQINFRIQSKVIPAVEVLVDGLNNLDALCKIVLDEFEESVNTYKSSQQE
ncbi:DNA-directed RNA polymerases I and III subunit RPAC2 [Octopus sinensis]|uniref:DNA-directed RNA polymerases I and III subunit RPAC2 n=1 Tax=Octopus sinensis TaxID=2607531 RepID=A0A6P7S7S8_9MOLL|nr:DNA-directed RNA polymerases I and III subunit RPAC2 [Octopus sinensis]